MTPSLCILIPCYNEAPSIRSVVSEHKILFPGAIVVVVDNGSTDHTGEIAKLSGAEVLLEPRKGKARAIVTALEWINTDLVIMVDGDGSYPAQGTDILFSKYMEQPADLITGVRVPEKESVAAFRPLHRQGARLFSHCVSLAFGIHPRDVFSGARLFSKRFYKNVPILSSGFELEMELTVQAIDKGFRIAEIEIPFSVRAEQTESKLRTVRDGCRILKWLLVLFRDYKPLYFFSIISFFFLILGLYAGFPPVLEYFETGFVGRFPLAILAAALMNISIFILLNGVVSESNLRYHREAFQIRLRNYR